jgi:hypothetical protein
MKPKIIMSGLLALALSGLTVNACLLTIRVACPNDITSAGIEVCVKGVGCATTDEFGIAKIDLPAPGDYLVTVTKSTLPQGATIGDASKTVTVPYSDTTLVCFELGGDFCGTPPPQGDCWLTGGGTVDKTKGVANYSFGGVVYPGCSPKAAEGGNWNVVDHFAGLHFQGQQIIVDGCSGVATRSPKVNVNIIDFHGWGILSGVAGTPLEKTAVTFVGRAVDVLEPGGARDMLYLKVTSGSTTLMQIGTSAEAPAVISTGNLQIHTTGCGKYAIEPPQATKPNTSPTAD